MPQAKSPQPAYEEFVFTLHTPSLSYGFSVQHDRRRRETDPFEAHHAVHFATDCLWPARFRGRAGRATIYPEPAFLDPSRLGPDDVRRSWIGYVRATKAVFEVTVYLPPPICWPLAEAMRSELVTSMLTNGRTETRGMNRVSSVSFRGAKFDPVEYIG